MDILLTLFCIALIVALLYFFGVFDQGSTIGPLIGSLLLILGICVILYLVFASIHKVLGPFIFGG